MGIGPSVSPATQTAGGCRAARRHRQCWFRSCRVLASCRLPVCERNCARHHRMAPWAEVFGDDSRTGDIAVIGPIVGTIGSPAVGMFLDRFGTDTLFIALGVLHLVPLLFVHTSRLNSGERVHRERHRPTRSALLAMLALGCFTLGGSSVFVFSNSIGRGDVGMSALLVSLVYSCNSIAGIPSSRYSGQRKHAGRWILATGVRNHSRLCSSSDRICTRSDIVGIFFWMAVPACFSVLAAHSKYPQNEPVMRRPTWLGAESLDRSSVEPCLR